MIFFPHIFSSLNSQRLLFDCLCASERMNCWTSLFADKKKTFCFFTFNPLSREK